MDTCTSRQVFFSAYHFTRGTGHGVEPSINVHTRYGSWYTSSERLPYPTCIRFTFLFILTEQLYLIIVMKKMQSKRLACLLQYYYRSANVYKKQLPAI